MCSLVDVVHSTMLRLYCEITRYYAVHGNNMFKLGYTSENVAALKAVKLRSVMDDAK